MTYYITFRFVFYYKIANGLDPLDPFEDMRTFFHDGIDADSFRDDDSARRFSIRFEYSTRPFGRSVLRIDVDFLGVNEIRSNGFNAFY